MTMRREALQLGLLGSLLAAFGAARARAADSLVIDQNGVKIDQEAWKTVAPPDFKNGWVNWKSVEGYAPAGYFKDSLGIVHLRGVVQDGKVDWESGVIFALPRGYWPQYRSAHVVMASPGGVFGQLEVATNGDVIAAFLPEGISFADNRIKAFSLDGVAFRAV
jgi:hypothetical protein